MKQVLEQKMWKDLVLYLFKLYDSRDDISQDESFIHIDENFGVLKSFFWVIAGIVLTLAMGWLV